jgi:hypothetical protein
MRPREWIAPRFGGQRMGNLLKCIDGTGLASHLRKELPIADGYPPGAWSFCHPTRRWRPEDVRESRQAGVATGAMGQLISVTAKPVSICTIAHRLTRGNHGAMRGRRGATDPADARSGPRRHGHCRRAARPCRSPTRWTRRRPMPASRGGKRAARRRRRRERHRVGGSRASTRTPPRRTSRRT